MLKAVTVFANISIAQEISELLKESGIDSFTQWPRIIGQGSVTGARFDNHVWPGANTAFQIITDEKSANLLMDKLQEMRSSEMGQQSGIYAYMTSVERVLN